METHQLLLRAGYKLQKKIGTGSFCSVYLATHLITCTRYAIKVFVRSKLKENEGKLRAELKIWRLLPAHPHVIRVFDVRETDTHILMIMEHVPRGELFDYIVEQGKLSEEETRRLFTQLVSAVQHLHHHDIIHRDLKPENILLDAEHRVKLIDFGFAARLREGELHRTSCGSPNYAAPEIVSSQDYAGTEVDVWSLGVILFTMLCGYLPFDQPSVPRLFKQIRTAAYTVPHHVSEGARRLMQRILVADAKSRPRIADLWNDAWLNPAFTTLSEIVIDPMPSMSVPAQHTFGHTASHKVDSPADPAIHTPAFDLFTVETKQVVTLMDRLYGVLKQWDCAWQTVELYHLKIRFVDAYNSVMKCVIRIYRTNRDDTYVVDVKYSSGPVFSFLRWCGALYTHLTVPPIDT